MDDVVERINVMVQKEQSDYATSDYLAPDAQQLLSLACESEALLIPPSANASNSSGSSSASGINEIWREKICEWSYQVIDHFDFSREVVSVSIHFLDRYLATRTVGKKMFQLAAMTCLFIAIKLYETGRLSMPSMIELSRGYFTVKQMAAMELSILRALSWHVHPPTAFCFSKHLLHVLPYAAVPMEVRYDILELSRFLTELSVIDYFFVIQRPSSVAIAALLNSMEEIPGVSPGARAELIRAIQRIPDLDAMSPEVVDCRNRLRLLYAQGGYSRPSSAPAESRDESISPVCVSHGIGYHNVHSQDEKVSGYHEQPETFTRATTSGPIHQSSANPINP